jgi:flagellar motor switch protein FliN
MTVGETLDLRVGSVVKLERLAGEPVDLLVNGTLIAQGEVVVADEQFGLRVTEIVEGDASGATPFMDEDDRAAPASAPEGSGAEALRPESAGHEAQAPVAAEALQLQAPEQAA